MLLGLDIGGANLKAVHLDGAVRVQPFALWRRPERLPAELAALLDKMPAADIVAVTMTGELCDCYESKSDGVNAILDAVATAAPGKKILVWRNDGAFTNIDEARQTPLQTAAANWLALAVYAGRFAPDGAALLIDVGTTTTDIIPLQDGKPIPAALTDFERLQNRELVYTGVKRTPVCALLGSAVMAELFATTWDVYLLLGDIPESDDRDTADGRPAKRAAAQARMARMLGGDATTCSEDEALKLARRAASVQLGILQHALQKARRQLSSAPKKIILSGAGEFLAQRLLHREEFAEENTIHLSDHLSPSASEAACAYALCVLASQQ